MMDVGIVGTGQMGRRAAEQLVAAGHTLFVHDASSEAARSVKGATALADPAALAAKAEVVLLYLPGPHEVAECVAGPRGLLSDARAGSVIVDQSTVDPGTSQRMAGVAYLKEVGYLDAPVLGRPSKVGQWSLPVGGAVSDLERCKPVLSALATCIVLIGPSGAGNQVKLLNQLMFGAINAMTAEMMAIAEKAGIAPKLLYETLAASNAGTVSNLFRELGARIADDNYEDPTFSIELLNKDVRLAVEMAKAHAAPPIIARGVELLNEAALAQGLGALDTAAMWKCYRRFWQRE